MWMVKWQLRKVEEGISLKTSEDLEIVFPIRSVTQSCPTLCDSMNRSMPGLPVHHQLPEFTQTHVHRVSDAIQPSHPLSSPSLPLSIFPRIRVFFQMSRFFASGPSIGVSASTSVLPMNTQDWFPLRWTGWSRKTSISALLTMPKPLTVWIKTNCGKLWKRWEYQTTWPASWESVCRSGSNS